MRSQRSASPRASSRARLVRGWLAATMAVFFAALSHSWAAALMINPVLLMLAVVFAAPITVLCAKNGFKVVPTGLAVVSAQVFFHTLFVAAPASGAGGVLAQEGHCGPITALPQASQLGASPTIGELALAHMTPSMVVAHLLAAAATTAVLCYGERALEGLAGLVLCLRPRQVLTWDTHAVVTTMRRIGGSFTAPISPVLSVLLNSLSHRGPPVAGFYLARA